MHTGHYNQSGGRSTHTVEAHSGLELLYTFSPSSGSPADLVHTCMAVAFELVEVHDEVQVREEGKQGVIPWLLGNFNFNPASPPIRT